jgi:hypothetical protein
MDGNKPTQEQKHNPWNPKNGNCSQELKIYPSTGATP